MFDFNLDSSIHKNKISIKSLYDVVIIGAGPGAYNAAIYSARNGLDTLIVAKDAGGQLLNTNAIDNYLGFYNISGEELNNHFLNHLNNFEVDQLFNNEVVKLTKFKDLFNVKLFSGEETMAKTVILATGGSPRKLNVLGEKEFTGRGVSYCVICDGAFYINKDVIVVGGGNSAMEAALDLSKYAKSIHIVQNLNDFTGDLVLANKVKTTNNITYQFNSLVKEIVGSDKLNSVIVTKDELDKEIKTDGIFVEIGIIPANNIVKDLAKINKFGEVEVNIYQETSIEGLYAIGDVTNFPYKQVITAASQGAVAALEANKYINKKEI